MSKAKAHYEIKITCTSLPSEMNGVPLPVEIISAGGTARGAVVTLQEEQSTTQPVDEPGRYFIRAELPSGQWVSGIAQVPEVADAQGNASGVVVLDLAMETGGSILRRNAQSDPALQPAETQRSGWQKFNKRLPTRLGTAGQRPLQKKTGSESQAVELPSGDAETPSAPTLRAVCHYGFFREWSTEASEGDGPRVDSLVFRGTGEVALNLPGSLTLEQHPGWSANSREWRPLLVQVKLAAANSEALVVWPPCSESPSLVLVPDPDTGVNREAPPLLALSKSGDRTLDALFSFVRGGALDSARQVAPTSTAQAEAFLSQKEANPIHATLAAYVLLKISSDDREDWIANLAERFEHLPDGAIIYAWYLIRAGQAEQAHKYFETALLRGVPMFTEGVRLLRDGLNFLVGLYPEDAQVQADAARARRMAAAVNLDSELTCLNSFRVSMLEDRARQEVEDLSKALSGEKQGPTISVEEGRVIIGGISLKRRRS